MEKINYEKMCCMWEKNLIILYGLKKIFRVTNELWEKKGYSIRNVKYQ